MNESKPPETPKGPEQIEQLNIKVLLADDEEFIRVASIHLLQRMGCTVKEVENGQQLLEELKSNPEEYGLVITDVRMPVLNGLKALEQIRADNRFERLPIIVNSGTFTPAEIELVRTFNALHLQKGSGINLFFTTVRQAVGRGKA